MTTTRLPGRRALQCHILIALFLLCQATAALAWSPEPSQPAKVIFYPDEVEVFVEESRQPEPLPSGGTGFLLAVPSSAARGSFMISIDGKTAGGYYWLEKEERDAIIAAQGGFFPQGRASLPENEPSPERRALLEKVSALAGETALKEGELSATESRIAFWTALLDNMSKGTRPLLPSGASASLPPAPQSIDELSKADKIFSEILPGLYQARDKQRRALDDARLRLGKATDDLARFDHRTGTELVAVAFPGPAKGAQTLSYSYTLSGSCAISYRLAADPAKEEVVIAQDVSLAQHSGFDWENPEVFVSTIRRDRALRPSNTRPWEVALQAVEKVAQARMMKEVAAAPAPGAFLAQAARSEELMGNAADERADKAFAPRPVAEERATFKLWSLGKQRVQTRGAVRLALAEDAYKATYYYTLRPASGGMGFLTAELALPSALELPPGMAQFSVDGAQVGQQTFSFNGDKGIIYFGSDPRVTVEMRDLKRTGGEQGFFSVELTRLWHWQFTLKNSRPNPVDVVLEDAAPVKRDESINIKTSSSPKPEEVTNAPRFGGATIYRWKATLKPGEPLVIDHKVEVAAPQSKDKILVPGR